jgi:hypothetical protein
MASASGQDNTNGSCGHCMLWVNLPVFVISFLTSKISILTVAYFSSDSADT